IVYADEEGNYYLQHLEYIRLAHGHGIGAVEDEGDRGEQETDEASAQCRIIADLARRFYLPSLMLETNGIGRFLPNILRNVLAKTHVPCRVQEIAQSTAKDTRILEGFDALLAARRLYVHESVRHTPFLTEMREWQPSG